MMLANASNYGFQIITGRFLSVEEYGLLGSFMSTLAVVTVSTGALQTTAARAVAQGRNVPGRSLRFDRLVRTALGIGGAGALAFIALSPWLMRFFDVGMLPVLALAIYVAPAALDSIAAGRLQGAQRFRGLGVYSATQAFMKLGVTTTVLLLGVGVGGVLFTVVVGATIVAVLGIRASRDLGALDVHALGRDARLGFAAFTLLWIALSVDVVFARANFEGDAAGLYAAGAVLGKAVLWLPVIVNQILFPRLTGSGSGTAALLRRAVAVVLAVASVAFAGLVLLGSRAFDLLYGSRYDGAYDASWRIGLAMIPVAVVNLLLYDFLARGDRRFIPWLGAAVIAECVALPLVPTTASAYSWVLGLTGLGVALALLALRFVGAGGRSELDDGEVVVP